MDELLSREEFQRAVFARDRGLCVICRQPAADAHHIVERRLWPDGGYYLGNGASLCPDCHWQAETTALSCDDIRRAAGIERVLLPWHLESGTCYDKWGNACLPDGTRAIGELFFDESVQRVLSPCSCGVRAVRSPPSRHTASHRRVAQHAAPAPCDNRAMLRIHWHTIAFSLSLIAIVIRHRGMMPSPSLTMARTESASDW